MGTLTAPVSGSASCPTCMALVAKPSCLVVKRFFSSVAGRDLAFTSGWTLQLRSELDGRDARRSIGQLIFRLQKSFWISIVPLNPESGLPPASLPPGAWRFLPPRTRLRRRLSLPAPPLARRVLSPCRTPDHRSPSALHRKPSGQNFPK